jgi:hypothetical protein
MLRHMKYDRNIFGSVKNPGNAMKYETRQVMGSNQSWASSCLLLVRIRASRQKELIILLYHYMSSKRGAASTILSGVFSSPVSRLAWCILCCTNSYNLMLVSFLCSNPTVFRPGEGGGAGGRERANQVSKVDSYS